MLIDCYEPKTMQELSEALSKMTKESKIIAGATDLVNRMNMGLCSPDALLYIGGVKELKNITKSDEYIEIGAASTMANIAKSELLTGGFKAIADAAADVGSVQIRNSGTIGGNIANASAAGDLLPTLFLLNAEVDILEPSGNIRRKPMAEVVLGPGKTSVAYNEAIVRFLLPVNCNKAFRSSFIKLGARKSLTISRIGLGISLKQDENGIIEEAKVVAGAISLTPVHVLKAEEYLSGKAIDGAAKKMVGKFLSELIFEITPEMFDRDYKVGAAFGIAEDVLSTF